MYIESKNMIFVHLPKTGGSFIQKHLLPYSADEMSFPLEHNDGHDRFHVKGRYTAGKHAPLSLYCELMPKQVFEDAVCVTCVRHPVERMVSQYFSPHAWLTLPFHKRVIRKLSIYSGNPIKYGPSDFILKKPYFDYVRFRAIVSSKPSMTSYFIVNGIFRKPDEIIKFENLKEDFSTFCGKYEFPLPDFNKVVNKSSYSESIQKFVEDPEVISLVKEFHMDDFDYFGYD